MSDPTGLMSSPVFPAAYAQAVYCISYLHYFYLFAHTTCAHKAATLVTAWVALQTPHARSWEE